MEVAPVIVTPNAARKRKRNPKEWKCNRAKKLRLVAFTDFMLFCNVILRLVDCLI